MAYGNGNSETIKRMVSLGVGDLTDSKLAALATLRARSLETSNHFMSLAFNPEPLKGLMSGDELEALLVKAQAETTGFNKAYVEKARLTVKNHAAEVHKRYIKQIIGRLRHCGSKIDTPGTEGRRYFYVPVDVQDHITQTEIEELAAYSAKPAAALELFSKVLFEGFAGDLSAAQIAVLQEIQVQVQKSYRQPVYGRDDGYTCQLHLDYRVISGFKKGLVLEPLNDGAARLLLDTQNKRYTHFLEVSNPTPRGEAIRLPMAVSKQQLHRLGIDGKDTKFKSFVLEIGEKKVEIKGVIEKMPNGFNGVFAQANAQPKNLETLHYDELAAALNQCQHLIGRDFGYSNTVSLSVVKRDREITPDEVRALLEVRRQHSDDAKVSMLQWFSEKTSGDGTAVEEHNFCGKNFLKGISSHCEHIDRLKSQIDGIYNKIGRLKFILADHLGIELTELVDEKADVKDPVIKSVHKHLFALLRQVKVLKQKRLSLYRKIAGLKKSWFGFLANFERNLAKKYQAALIREDLTVVATEKDGPSYKGRLFNKMINNGAKGQYIRRASDKLAWDGIPELALPSPYTSQACTRHSRLGKRTGEVFKCPDCNENRHADTHAAENIARLLILSPVSM